MITITAGDNHSVAIKGDGSLLAWGYNAYQQCNVIDMPKVIMENSSNGGGSRSYPLNSKISEIDDFIIENLLSGSNDIIMIDISNLQEQKAKISISSFAKLMESNKPLRIDSKGISLLFPNHSINIKDMNEILKNGFLEILAMPVDKNTRKEILSSIQNENNRLTELDIDIFDLSTTVISQSSTAIISKFNEPIAITVDFSSLNLSDIEISQLTGVRFQKDSQGNIVPVKLGGTYDAITNTFTFFTDQFSLTSVMKTSSLTKLKLSINKLESELNGVKVINDVPPVIVDGRTMVPIRYISENLGADVSWESVSKKVTITLDSQEFNLIIGESIKGFDSLPILLDGRTYVPLRYVSDKLGATVLWFPSTKSIEIVK